MMNRDTSAANGGDSTAEHTQAGLAHEAYVWQSKTVADLDDKAGRFVTGIAFFLTAIGTLFAVPQVRDAKISGLGHQTVQLPFLLLLGFLLMGAMSVLQLILAIAALTKPPRDEPLGQPSIYSFVAISEDTPEAWDKLFHLRPEDAVVYRRRALQREARKSPNLAAYKNGRIVEARAFLFFALAFLLVDLPLVAESLSSPTLVTEWTLGRCAGCAIALAAVVYVAANDRHRVESDVDSLLSSGSPREVFRDMAFSMSITAGCILLASTGNIMWLYLSWATLLPSCISLGRWKRRQDKDPSFLSSVPSISLYFLVLPSSVIFFVKSWQGLELIAALAPLMFFEGIRFADPALGRLQYLRAGFDRYLVKSGSLRRVVFRRGK